MFIFSNLNEIVEIRVEYFHFVITYFLQVIILSKSQITLYSLAFYLPTIYGRLGYWSYHLLDSGSFTLNESDNFKRLQLN
jgi:hypothetical protein